MGRPLRTFLIIFWIFALSFAGLFYGSIFLYERQGPLPTTKIVKINPGMGSGAIANLLQKEGVIDIAFLFKVMAFAKQNHRKLQAGIYAFEPHISIENVIDQLVTGRGQLFNITIPEGLTIKQVLELFKKYPDLILDHHTLPQEGYILPETYKIMRGIGSRSLFEFMERQMHRTLASLWKNRAPALPLKTAEEAIVLASIVERETALPEERPHVAAVFLNRLKKGMPLQADPTTIYALSNGYGKLERLLTSNDLKTDHKHNTYKYKGLPPTAIANPGYASLWAVLHPLPSDDLYFVVNGDGGHVFAKTLSDHQKNVQRYRKRQLIDQRKEQEENKKSLPQKRGGKSVSKKRGKK